MRRLAFASAAALLAFTSLFAGPAHRTAAASAFQLPIPLVPFHPPGHGDYQIYSINAWMSGTDLDVLQVEAIAPQAQTGGSPLVLVMGIDILHNFNPAAVPEFTSADGAQIITGPPTPQPSYRSGFGIVSGADVSIASTSAYAALFAGGERPSFLYGFPGAATAYPFYVQGTATTSGWLHFNNSTASNLPPLPPNVPYADSGTLTVTLRGVLEHVVPGPPIVRTFYDGALQLTFHNQPPVSNVVPILNVAIGT